MSEQEYWVGFANLPQVGPVRFRQILSQFGSAKAAWSGDEEGFVRAGLGRGLAKKIIAARNAFALDTHLLEIEKRHTQPITLLDDEYPESLEITDKPPFVLFCKGNLSLLQKSNRKVAVVGTRMVTEYGREVTGMFTRVLVDSGFVIVSGLAIGVDSVAHMTTIDQNGKTIAVLGCGIECCYPASNASLYREILKSGLIISEYPGRMSPSKGSFPARNRIIAGVSEAVLVTEGGEDSGSIITAMEGLKYGKKLFAVPGPITSRLSQGPFKIMQKGAKLVTKGEDILEALSIKGIKSTRSIQGTKEIRGETKEEQKILELLANESLHFDEIVKKTGLESSAVGVVLSALELKGYVKQVNGLFAL